MDKGQVAVQRKEIDKAFTYQREQELKEKSFYPLPYSKSSLVLLWTGLFESEGTHFVLYQKCCVFLWIKLQPSVCGHCMKMLLLKRRHYNWHIKGQKLSTAKLKCSSDAVWALPEMQQRQNPMELICELSNMTDMLIHELKGGRQNLKYNSCLPVIVMWVMCIC